MESEPNIIKAADIIIYPDLGLAEVNNKKIRLGPVNMKVLLELVNNQDRVVSRTELFDTVWNNQIISDDTLTKCISEIRTKLGKHSSHQKLIKTIPKKGYQWSPRIGDKSTSSPQLKKTFKSYLHNLLLIAISIIVLTTSFLWLANKLTEIKHVPILLLPIESDNENNKIDYNILEELLRKNILKTKNIRFLSKLVLRKGSIFSILNRHNSYKILWAIEGNVRRLHQEPNKELRFTLNLIDTRTGIETYTKSIETENNSSELDKFSLEFIEAVERRIKKH